MKADTTKSTSQHVRLYGNPLAGEQLETLGEWNVEVWSDFNEVGEEDPANVAWLRCSELLMLADIDKAPLGFCSYDLKWTIEATGRRSGCIELEVEVHEVWVKRSLRKQGLGTLMCLGVCEGVRSSMRLLETETDWGRRKSEKMSLVFAADVYSESGERFLRDCAYEFSRQVPQEPDLPHLVVSSATYDPRW